MFFLKEKSETNFSVYNSKGIEVLSKKYNVLNKGKNTIRWNPNNVSSGLYFYLIRTPNEKFAGRALYVK